MTDTAREVGQYEPPAIAERAEVATPLIMVAASFSTPSAAFRPDARSDNPA
jgi:hypothetical protein